VSANRVIAVLGALALCAAACAGARPAAAAPAATSEVARTLESCLQRSRQLLVAFEIDRSGSLAVTDPENRRVDAIGAALIGLTRLAEEGTQRRARVEVLLGSFAGTALPPANAVRWRNLDGEDLDRVLDEASGYASENWARDTDYVLALAAARQALDARASELASDGAPTPCKLLILVSDGGYELTDRAGQSELPTTVQYAPGLRLDRPGNAARAMAIGRRVLCRPGGLMDQLAGDGILRLVVALSTAHNLDPADRAFLGALATGSDAGQRCGSQLSSASGAVIDVTEDLDLFLVFDDLVDHSTPDHDLPLCVGLPCTGASRSFLAQPGLDGFLLDASAATPGWALALTDPAGRTTTIPSTGPARLTLAGASLSQHWFDRRSLDLQARFDPRWRGSWRGWWRFAFLATEAGPPPAYTLRLHSELRPRLIGDPIPVGGSTSAIDVELVDGSGDPATATPLASAASLHARLAYGASSRALSARRHGDGRFVVELPYPPGGREPRARLELEVRFPSAGAPIEPVLASLPLPRAASLGSPRALWLIGLAGALALGAALALLFGHWLRAQKARFVPPQRLRGLLADVVVVPGALVELDPDPGVPYFDDLSRLRRDGHDRRTRRIEYAGFTFTSHVPLRPFAPARAEATAGGWQLLGGTLDELFADAAARRVCVVPLKLSGVWLLAVEGIDAEGRIRGRLLVLTGEGERVGHCEAVLEAARAQLLAYDWEDFEREAAGSEQLDPPDDLGWSHSFDHSQPKGGPETPWSL
jgi:hypothetical protein